MQFFILSCSHGLSSWLSARFSTLLMLAGVCTGVCQTIHYQSNGLIQPVMSIFSLSISFYQHSIVCVLSENILHKLAAP